MLTNRVKYSPLTLLALLAGVAACSDGATEPTSPAAATPRALLFQSGASVQSVEVSPTSIPSGGLALGTVRLASSTRSFTTVNLSTTNPSILKVPSSVTLDGGDVSASFKVAAISGAAGCARVVASAGFSSERSDLIYVLPSNPSSSPLTLSLASAELLGVTGASTTGTVGLVVYNPDANMTSASVQLSSSNPLVAVPAKVSVPMSAVDELVGVYAGTVTFPVTITAPAPEATCAVITATYGDAQRRVLLRVAPYTNIGG